MSDDATTGVAALVDALARGTLAPDGPQGDETPAAQGDWLPTWAADDELLRAEVLAEARRISASDAHRCYQAGWAAGVSWLADRTGIPVSLTEIVEALDG